MIERQGGVNNPELELPEAHIRGDVNTPYRCIGGTIYKIKLTEASKTYSLVEAVEPGEIK